MELKMNNQETRCKTLLRKCTCYKTGTLITIEVFGKEGAKNILWKTKLHLRGKGYGLVVLYAWLCKTFV